MFQKSAYVLYVSLEISCSKLYGIMYLFFIKGARYKYHYLVCMFVCLCFVFVFSFAEVELKNICSFVFRYHLLNLKTSHGPGLRL